MEEDKPIQLSKEYIVHPVLGLRRSASGWILPHAPDFEKKERNAYAMVQRWWRAGFPVSTEESCWAMLHIVLTNVPAMAKHGLGLVVLTPFEARVVEALYRLKGRHVQILSTRLFQFFEKFNIFFRFVRKI